MSGLITIFAGLLRTLFIRLPLGIWLAVLFSAGWMLLERQYDPNFPLFPCTTTWPPEFSNPSYPENPSQLAYLLEPVVEQISALKLGVGAAELTFGRVEYGALLGALFGLLLCWPCGIWMTMRRYSGVLLFPFRVILLGLAYGALGGAVGYGLAHLWGANLISTGYMAVFGLAMPILVPLPFWLLRPIFPSAARRQASVLMKKANREAKTTLADIAKLDPAIGDVTKGKQQKEWDYYATVAGLFLGLLLGEKRGAPKYQRTAVEKLLRRKLNKKFEKGDPGLTAVSQFCKEYLEKGAKFSTEILVGLWLAMQMKGGDLHPARDKDLATSLGGHIVQGMSRVWPARSRVGSFLAAILLWAGVGGLALFAMNPNQVQGQIAWLQGNLNQPVNPAADPASTPTPAPRALGDLDSADSTADPAPSGEPSTTETTTTEDPTAGDPMPKSFEQGIPSDKEESSPPAPPASSADSADNALAQQPLEPTGSPGETTPSLDADKPAEEKNLAETPTAEEPENASLTKEKESKANPTTEEPSPLKEAAPAEPSPVEVASAPREWSHSSGRKLQATAVAYRYAAVELRRADGRSAFIALKDLSQEDREVVYSHFAGENQEGTSPAQWNGSELRIHRWSSADGSKQVTAAILKVSADSVELLRADGRIFSLPVKQMSATDQGYVHTLSTVVE